MTGGTTLAVALSATAGLSGAVQIAVMSELGERAGVFPAIALSGVVAFVLGIVVLYASGSSLGGIRDTLREPAWLWTGGAISLFIILAMTVAGPRIGIAATLGILIGGNLVSGALIDHFGLLGLDRIPIGWPRALGIVLLGIGAALSLHKA
ncbi:MAG: DMT family transporter [Gaiellaceae bacterium]